jgi:transcriptional regulator with GAF, ATPase, and Fis domain
MIERELADGEIVEEWRLPATPERKAAADVAFQRFTKDTRALTRVMADPERREAEWVAVFDGAVFRSGDFEDVLQHVKALGATDSPVLVRYARARCDDLPL